MKIVIELDDKDWGKVATAVIAQLGRERKYAHDLSYSNRYRVEQEKRVAAFARIKQAIAYQRKTWRSKWK